MNARALRPSAMVVAVFLALPGGRAVAQPEQTTSPRTQAITLVLELTPRSSIDARRLQGAIARELGVTVVAEAGAPGGTLVVRQGERDATVSFSGPGGRHDTRTLSLEGGTSQVERDIVLIVGNVVRDQVSPFAQAMPPPTSELVPAPPTSEPVPAPPASAPGPAPAPPAPPSVAPPSPCARAGLSPDVVAPISIDFAPFVGTSSFAWGRSRHAVSVGALGAFSRGIRGAALSGLTDLAAGPVCGVQLAGLATFAKQVQGVQVAGLADVATGVRGAQVAGLVGVATDVRGAQIAGLAAVAPGDSGGLQFSPVNVAGGRWHGVQIGVINVANDADAQVGLLNVDFHGRFLLEAWSKPEAGAVLAGIEHGPAHMHSIYAFEVRVTSGRPWAVLGLGAHLTPSDRVYVDLDVLQHVQLAGDSGGPNQLSELRVVAGYSPSPWWSAFVGPTFNVLAARDPHDADAPSFAWTLDGRSSTAVMAWPGIALGVEGL